MRASHREVTSCPIGQRWESAMKEGLIWNKLIGKDNRSHKSSFTQSIVTLYIYFFAFYNSEHETLAMTCIASF